jgi:hypothetical protein
MKRSHSHSFGYLLQIVEEKWETERFKDEDCNYLEKQLIAKRAETEWIKKHSPVSKYKDVEWRDVASFESSEEEVRSTVAYHNKRDACGRFSPAKRQKTEIIIEKKEAHYSCKECNFAASRKQHMDVHRRMHYAKQKNSASVYHCEECDYLTDVYRRFNEHVAVHQNVKLYECSQGCGARFKVERSMDRHVESKVCTKS